MPSVATNSDSPRSGSSARFLAFEGGEGAGKSTQIVLAEQYLIARGQRVLRSREPGGSAFAEQLRRAVLDPSHAGLSPKAELLTMFAARADHVERVIRPALAQGQWVLCDRFTWASYAYQGAARGLGAEVVAWLEAFAIDNLRPDLTVLFDLPVAIGRTRVTARAAASGQPTDRVEKEDDDFFQRVREEYLRLAQQDERAVQVIDAQLSLQQVQSAVQQCLVELGA